MSVQTDGSVRHEVVLDQPVAQVFWAFADLDRIKPRDHNLMEVEIAETVLEPRAGGDVYDRGVDGTVCRWGRVLAFDPTERIAFSWDIGPQWQVEEDPARTSEVEVTFTAEADDRTRVVLVHRHLERHGEGWEGLRGGVDADGGWPLYLARLGEAARAGATAG